MKQTSNKEKPYTIYRVMWRLSSIILIPIVFFSLIFIRPIKWLFTGKYYPTNSQKIKKTLLYKWLIKSEIGFFH